MLCKQIGLPLEDSTAPRVEVRSVQHLVHYTEVGFERVSPERLGGKEVRKV